MFLLTDYWPSLTAFMLFGVLHSLGAQEGSKDWMRRRLGLQFVESFWRITYCAGSYAFLYHVIGALHWDLHPQANIWLYHYPEWLWRVLLLLHLLSIILIYWAFIQSDYLEFWGLRQAWQGLISPRTARDIEAVRLFGTHRLVVAGIYGRVRHPMLSGGLLFLLTSGPSKNNLVFLGMYLAYMLVGAWYEEKRLVRIFGEEYRQYQQRVGAFVPRLRSNCGDEDSPASVSSSKTGK